MAQIDLFIPNFALILSTGLLNLPLLLANVFAIDPSRRSADVDAIAANTSRRLACNFNEVTRAYNATDLLVCMNELASAVLLQPNIDLNKITDRAYQNSRQSYLTYPDYSIMPIAGAASNYFNDDMLTSLLSGALPLSSLSNLFNFNGFTRPGFNFFKALSSISQYDDLKCVPRILCEVASGSMPGNVAYAQNSGFQDFGKNALFRLLTAFDVGGSSPILSFGKAALLGYTNRGQSSMCYQEYPRCPRNPNQLISYLNNHNGGFFRFFNGNRDNHYRPQQSYKPYYRNPDVEYRIVGPKTEHSKSEAYLGPEGDRTGTGKLSFATVNFYNKNINKKFYPMKLKDRESSKLVFPGEDYQQIRYQSNRVTKAHNNIFENSSTNKVQEETLQKDHKFFPQEHADEVLDVQQSNVFYYNKKPRNEQFQNEKSLVHFPHDTIFKDTSTFTFSNNYRDN